MERALRADPERFTRPPEPEVPQLTAAHMGVSHSHQISPQPHYTVGSTTAAYTYNSHTHTINSTNNPTVHWNFPTNP